MRRSLLWSLLIGMCCLSVEATFHQRLPPAINGYQAYQPGFLYNLPPVQRYITLNDKIYAVLGETVQYVPAATPTVYSGPAAAPTVFSGPAAAPTVLSAPAESAPASTPTVFSGPAAAPTVVSAPAESAPASTPTVFSGPAAAPTVLSAPAESAPASTPTVFSGPAAAPTVLSAPAESAPASTPTVFSGPAAAPTVLSAPMESAPAGNVPTPDSAVHGTSDLSGTTTLLKTPDQNAMTSQPTAPSPTSAVSFEPVVQSAVQSAVTPHGLLPGDQAAAATTSPPAPGVTAAYTAAAPSSTVTVSSQGLNVASSPASAYEATQTEQTAIAASPPLGPAVYLAPGAQAPPTLKNIMPPVPSASQPIVLTVSNPTVKVTRRIMTYTLRHPPTPVNDPVTVTFSNDEKNPPVQSTPSSHAPYSAPSIPPTENADQSNYLISYTLAQKPLLKLQIDPATRQMFYIDAAGQHVPLAGSGISSSAPYTAPTSYPTSPGPQFYGAGENGQQNLNLGVGKADIDMKENIKMNDMVGLLDTNNGLPASSNHEIRMTSDAGDSVLLHWQPSARESDTPTNAGSGNDQSLQNQRSAPTPRDAATLSRLPNIMKSFYKRLDDSGQADRPLLPLPGFATS